MSRWVTDASSVAAYLLGEASGAERSAILQGACAPTLLDVEVTNTLRGLLRGNKIDHTRAEAARFDLRVLRMRRYPEQPLLRRAWDLRDRCTVYEGLYVALAEALDATLVTRDVRLGRSVQHLVEVRIPG